MKQGTIASITIAGIVGLCGSAGVAARLDPQPRPMHQPATPTPTPTQSCYVLDGDTNAPMGSRYSGGYKPCDRSQSVEEEERTRQNVDEYNRSDREYAEKEQREERERKEFWDEVRRERLERERTGQTPGGPVTVPPPGPLPS